MANYYFGADEHVESSMRAILELAGDRAGEIQYRPGVGAAGAVELPEDVADEWVKIKADHDAEQAAAADTDDEDDDEDESGGAVEAAPSGRTSRRTAAKTQE